MSKHASSLAVATTLLLAALWGCGGSLPASKLTAQERQLLAETASFERLFTVVRRTRLAGDERQPLSVRPLLKAIDREGRFVILDKLNVRRIYLFTGTGEPAGEIGREGRSVDAYIYPHCLAYDPVSDEHFVYDGDLLRVQRFSGDGRFLGLFPVALNIDQLVIGEGETLIGYSSRMAHQTGPGDLVYVLDRQGKVLRHFAPQSEAFTRFGASEGGGVARAAGVLYFVTPYELTVTAYSHGGRALGSYRGRSVHYTPPPPAPEPGPDDDTFALKRRYHRQWSHIRQILSFDDKLIGVVFAEPGEARVFLKLLDLDLTPLAELLLPPYRGELLTHGDRLYLMSSQRRSADGTIHNPTVVEYRLQTGESGE